MLQLNVQVFWVKSQTAFYIYRKKSSVFFCLFFLHNISDSVNISFRASVKLNFLQFMLFFPKGQICTVLVYDLSTDSPTRAVNLDSSPKVIMNLWMNWIMLLDAQSLDYCFFFFPLNLGFKLLPNFLSSVYCVLMSFWRHFSNVLEQWFLTLVLKAHCPRCFLFCCFFLDVSLIKHTWFMMIAV